MIPREHLELAALAAGMTPVRMSEDGRGLLVAEQAEPWRPHLDDGDAARLQVRMEMQVKFLQGYVVAIPPLANDLPASAQHDGTEPDKLRAWREAVVLCAAAVGEKMKGGER